MPERIIVRCPNWIGDQVMALDFYRALRHHYSKSHITWLMKESLRGLPTFGLVDEILVLPQTARALRDMKFDLSISLPATLRSSYLFCAAKIPNRVGFSRDGNEIFYTSHMRWKGRSSKKHKSRLYLDFFEFLTSETFSYRQSPSAPIKRQKTILLAPGASISLREWPYFEELLELLSKQYPEYTLKFVGAKESERWHPLLEKKQNPKIVDLIEKTSLENLVEECKTAALVIANDSGVAHLASTLGRAKTIVLFGPGDPHYILPDGWAIPLRVEGLRCSPCEKPYCKAPFGYQACLKQLSSSQVLEAIQKAL